MKDYMKFNQDRWNELVDIHTSSQAYNLAGFKAGDIRIRALERAEIGDVTGKSLLHLQCHFGIDTLSWVRLGAQVTGVDYSDKAIEVARSLSLELGLAAHFVCSNVYDLPEALDGEGQFDIVYTSHGVIGWLPDLQPWAKVIAHYLKPGGFFYIAEAHPFMWVFDETAPDFRTKYPYFEREPIESIAEYSYADKNTKVVNTVEYGWNHTFSEILCSLINAGLRIDFLHEHPFCAWECFPGMEENDSRWYTFIDSQRARMLPLSFSLKATRV